MNETNEIYGLVLCGGKSSRMKQDKALIHYHDKAQVEHVYALLKKHCQKVYVSIRFDQKENEVYQKYPCIIDEEKDCGPVNGMISAMKEHQHVAWLVLACDMPLVTSSSIEYLILHRDANQWATCFKGYQNKPEPLFAIYEPQARKILQKGLERGISCPRKMIINSSSKLLEPEDSLSLSNANTPEELKTMMSFTQGAFA